MVVIGASAQSSNQIMLLNAVGGILAGAALLWLCVICIMRERISLAISLGKSEMI
jgi:hypothetical protein